MNKQEFKKAVEATSASICNQMITVNNNVEGVDKDKISVAVTKILSATKEAKSNANHFFGLGYKEFNEMKEYRMSKRKFFRELFVKIREDYNNEIAAALKLFNEAVPNSPKDINKY